MGFMKELVVILFSKNCEKNHPTYLRIGSLVLLRTTVMNPKNRLVDHQGSLPILDKYTTHWYGCSQHASYSYH